MKKEQSLQKAICTWLKLQHPNVYFFSDPSGIKMSIGMAVQLKANHSAHAQLDLVILEPRGEYHAMVLELKRETPYRKNGELKKSDHLTDQLKTVANLQVRGYYVKLAWEFDTAKKLIGKYLEMLTLNHEN